MAGTIICDFIRSDANQLSLNVGNTVVATINASGILSNTGTVLINPNGTIIADNIQTGNLNSSLLSGTISKSRLPTGLVLQVAQGWKSDTFSTTSTSLQDVSGLSVTLTPLSTSSKFLIMVNMTYLNTFYVGHVALIRNSTEIGMADTAGSRPRNLLIYSNSTNGGADGQWVRESMDYLDSPSTSSSITYKIQASARRDGQGGTMYINRSAPDRDTTGYDGRGVSSIVVMEIAQ